MDYRRFGNTDHELSLICLGTMTWGEQNTAQQAFAQMDYALSKGVNFWDCAEMYPVAPRPATQGASERIIGEWFAHSGRRAEVFLASKVTGRGDRNAGLDHIRGGPRLSRDHIMRAIEGSLERLQTDYLDLYQVHWPERQTNFFGKLGYTAPRPEDAASDISIQETYAAMAELVDQGLVRHIGVSNETPWGILEYQRLAEEHGYPAIQSIQNPYNLLNRSYEVGLAEISLMENISLLAYSPLAFGTLSGKYLNGARPARSRLVLFDRFVRYTSELAQQATAAYVELARAHQLDPAQMALAYVNSRTFCSANIIGATSMAQLESNIASVELQLSPEVLQGIEAIHTRYSNPAP